MSVLARARLARLAPPVAASLLLLLVRALPHPMVFTDSGIFPNAPDAYYHLRRIAYTVAAYPAFLDFDPYVNFPDGGRPIWTPLFDFALATLARLCLGAQTGPPLEAWLMWVPPLLGVATLLALHALVRRTFGAGVAALAAFVLALLPAHFVYSQLGELDHHAAVALAVTLVLAASLPLLRAERPGRGGLLTGALPLGAAHAFALLLWPGCLLAVAAADAALGVRVATFARREAALALARRCALAHGIAFALLLPFAFGSEWERWGSLSPVVLSRFQPLFCAAGALGFGLLGELLGRRFPASPARRAALALALLAGLLALALAALPQLGAGAREAWEWLARREAFQARVAESEPLLRAGRGLETGLVAQLFSRLAYASPLLLGLLALGARGREDAAARVFVAFWTCVWLVAALVQRRFVNELSVPFALLVALAAADAVRALRRAPLRRSALAGLASLAAGVWLLAPIMDFYAPYVANIRRLLAGEPRRLLGWQPAQRSLEAVARWLAEHSPPTAGFWDASARPEYGVLAAWGDGHVLRYVAQRPVVQDNFGDDVGVRNFALAEAYFAQESEEQALRIARELRVRYVLVRASGSGHSAGYGARSQFARLYELRGAEGVFGGAPGAREQRIRALAHHRLIFDAEAVAGLSAGSRPSYKIFEIVPGARIAGRALPGAEVRAELRIALGRRGRIAFSITALADADGRYELVVPYANDPTDREIRPARAYRLRSGGREASLAVSDAEVLGGAQIEAPPLAG